MKVKILRNVGSQDLRKFGGDHKDLLEGAVVEVEKDLAEKLIEGGIATTDTSEVKAVSLAPEVKAVPPAFEVKAAK